MKGFIFFFVLLALSLPIFGQTTATLRPIYPGNCEGKGEKYASFLEKISQQESEQELLIDVRFIAGGCKDGRINLLYRLEDPYIFHATLDQKGTPWYKRFLLESLETEVLHIGVTEAIFRFVIPKEKIFEKHSKRKAYFEIAPGRQAPSFPWGLILEYSPEKNETQVSLRPL